VNQYTRISLQVKTLLSSPDNAVSAKAAQLLRKLISKRWAGAHALLESEVSRSLAWLNSPLSTHYAAALHVLTEAFAGAPSAMRAYAFKALPCVTKQLRSPQRGVRRAAALALNAGLAHVASRDAPALWHNFLFQEMQQRDDLAALLVCQALVEHGGSFMLAHLAAAGDLAIRMASARDPDSHDCAIALLPALAQYSPQEFSAHSSDGLLAKAVWLLIRQGGEAELRALGGIAVSCGDSFAVYVEPVIQAIRTAIEKRSSKAALVAVAQVAQAVGPAIVPHADGLLDEMCAAGLSSSLCSALAVLVEVDELANGVRERLLDMLSMALVGIPFRPRQPGIDAFELQQGLTPRHYSMPAIAHRMKASSNDRPWLAANATAAPEVLVLALNTLGSFDFGCENLSLFLRQDVLALLSHELPSVRIAAIHASSHIVMSNTMFHMLVGAGVDVASSLADQLISTSVMDTNAEVRLTAVRALENCRCLDFHLSRTACVRTLQTLLNDEQSEVRLAVVGIIGRLATTNAAHVMPLLRHLLLQLLTAFKHAQSSNERRECAGLLLVAVRAAEDWVQPHVAGIYRIIEEHMDEGRSQLDIGAALARASGKDMAKHMGSMLKGILRALGDQTSIARQLAGLQALSSCATFSGLVIKPLIAQPTLLPSLVQLLRTDASEQIRLEVLRAIGALGAIDPHALGRRATRLSGKKHAAPNVMEVAVVKPNEMLEGGIPTDSYGTAFTDNPYYASVAVSALVRILQDPAQAVHYRQAVQALTSVFNALQNGSQSHLQVAVPAILGAMDAAPSDQAHFYIENLGRIAMIARDLIRPYVEPMFKLLESGPSISVQRQTATIELIEVLYVAMAGDLGIHCSATVTFLLSTIALDKSYLRVTTQRALHALRILGPSLERYVSAVLPRLIELLNVQSQPLRAVEEALETTAAIAASTDCHGFASRIVLTLVRMLHHATIRSLQTAIMDVFCTLAMRLQDDFVHYLPTIASALKATGIAHERYTKCTRSLLLGRLAAEEPVPEQLMLYADGSAFPLGHPDNLQGNVAALQRIWRMALQCQSREDWLGWLHSLSIEFLQQSSSPALRACAPLAFTHNATAARLFNAAFMSCWTELPGPPQQELISLVQDIVLDDTVPAELLQVILALAEYMERDEKPMPIDIGLLSACASRCHAVACELHYQETAWALEETEETAERLIALNTRLELHDAATGMLDYVRTRQPGAKENAELYVRLHRWDRALQIIDRQEHTSGPTTATTTMKLRCLFELSDWERLVPLFQDISPDRHPSIAHIGANMSWTLGDLAGLEKYTPSLPTAGGERSFSEALVAVLHNRTTDAARAIKLARHELETDFSSHLAESYSRGFTHVFRCQMLTELEEVMEFRTAHSNRERQLAIAETWRLRMQGVPYDVNTWRRLLWIHSLAIRPIQDLDMWAKFINLCRKTRQMNIARHALCVLANDESGYMHECARAADCVSQDSIQVVGGEFSTLLSDQKLDESVCMSQHPLLKYTYLKYLWANNHRQDAYQRLGQCIAEYTAQLSFDIDNPHALSDRSGAAGSRTSGGACSSDLGLVQLLARLLYKRAEWLTSLLQDTNLGYEAKRKAALGANEAYPLSPPPDSRESATHKSTPGSQTRLVPGRLTSAAASDATKADELVLKSYHAATVLHSKWYKAWHSLASQHYYETQKLTSELNAVPEDAIERHVVPAVNGFFRAIKLAKKDTTLQDTLRLLTVWFNHPHHSLVVQAVQDGIHTVSIRTWLQVIPQLLARIHIQPEKTSFLIQWLLADIGKQYPQAVLLPLYVAARSENSDRGQAARIVLEKLHDRTPVLVEETEVVSRELIRLALLFPEMWRDALDVASKHYFQQNDIPGMIRVMAPLHERARNPQTVHEYHFVQACFSELSVAEEYTAQYLASKPGRCKKALIEKVWAAYHAIFVKANKMMLRPCPLALRDTAPVLLDCCDMQLAVPGTYDPDMPLVRIASFKPTVDMYDTKQRPRDMHIYGSDGHTYIFLLKGHDDMRQDERVMQIFGLVNSLLNNDSETAQRALAIERYPAIPLSSNTGLIGFYSNSESLTDIIRGYRSAHNLPLNLERQMVLQFAPNWDTLTALQKVEGFEYALSNTPGNDLQRAMWYKAPSAEKWLERRTQYTRSMAVLSIIGFILGLGDRHLTNIMMHTETGKAVHIDFGDCFEIASQRKEFPETVPFRLTRMVVMPMEVGSIEGTFKITAGLTMRVLRANSDSLMAVLEAFVFDPLVSWSYTQDAASSASNLSAQHGPKKQELLEEWQISQSSDSDKIEYGSRPDKRMCTSDMARMADFAGHRTMQWQAGNPKAMAILTRIASKLQGTDFDKNEKLTVAMQVDKLIQQATSSENLAV
ncbi:phosphatidylinositol kinase- protein kinase tor1, partial [Linderina pennispora]